MAHWSCPLLVVQKTFSVKMTIGRQRPSHLTNPLDFPGKPSMDGVGEALIPARASGATDNL